MSFKLTRNEAILRGCFIFIIFGMGFILGVIKERRNIAIDNTDDITISYFENNSENENDKPKLDIGSLEFYDKLKENEDDKQLDKIKSGTQGERSTVEKINLKKDNDLVNAGKKVKKSAKHEGKRPNRSIQIASFRDQKTADRLVNTLNKKGYQAHRSVKKIPSKGIWHRVRIDNFQNENEADQIIKRLNKDKYQAILIKR